jgi:hypothetical protein
MSRTPVCFVRAHHVWRHRRGSSSISTLTTTLRASPTLCRATSAPPIPENSESTLMPFGYSGLSTEKWNATVYTEKLFPSALYLAVAPRQGLEWSLSNPNITCNYRTPTNQLISCVLHGLQTYMLLSPNSLQIQLFRHETSKWKGRLTSISLASTGVARFGDVHTRFHFEQSITFSFFSSSVRSCSMITVPSRMPCLLAQNSLPRTVLIQFNFTRKSHSGKIHGYVNKYTFPQSSKIS